MIIAYQIILSGLLKIFKKMYRYLKKQNEILINYDH